MIPLIAQIRAGFVPERLVNDWNSFIEDEHSMVQNNKVLTVSYGTFSCTLEGFDDSFGTMKAIAGYFRDLAADDRYFGAEPPQPDADMLARIAQRAIARQVEAHTDGTGIVLRAADHANGELAAPEAAAPVPKPTPETVKPDTTADDTPVAPTPLTGTEETGSPAEDTPLLADASAGGADDPVAEQPVVADMPLAEDMPAESIAAKLQRIRAVVSRNDASIPEVEFSEDEHAEAFVADTARDISDVLEQEDDVQGAVVEDDSDLIDDVLARFDSAHRTEDAASDADGGDVGIDTDEAGVDAVADSAAAPDSTDAGPDHVAPPIQAADTVSEDDQSDAGEEAGIDADDLSGPAPESADDVAAPYLLEAKVAPLQDEDTASNDEDLFADIGSDGEIEDEDIVQNILTADEDREEVIAEDDGATSDRPARVLKVRRADIDAAIAGGDLEPIEEDHAAAPIGDLSAEDEEYLMRELAEVEAELDHHKAESEVHETTSDADAGIIGSLREDAQMLPETDVEEIPHADLTRATRDQPDISRLMAEADSKMDEPETSSRQEAYNHLRAAVAATQAEQSITGETAGTETSDDAYRSDLASVVRPRRPAAATAVRLKAALPP